MPNFLMTALNLGETVRDRQAVAVCTRITLYMPRNRVDLMIHFTVRGKAEQNRRTISITAVLVKPVSGKTVLHSASSAI